MYCMLTCSRLLNPTVVFFLFRGCCNSRNALVVALFAQSFTQLWYMETERLDCRSALEVDVNQRNIVIAVSDGRRSMPTYVWSRELWTCCGAIRTRLNLSLKRRAAAATAWLSCVALSLSVALRDVDGRHAALHSRRVPIFTRGLAPLVVVHLAGWPGSRMWLPAIPTPRRTSGAPAAGSLSAPNGLAIDRRQPTVGPTDGRTVERGVLPVPLGRAYREEGPTNRLAGQTHMCCATVTPRRTARSPDRPRHSPLTPCTNVLLPAGGRADRRCAVPTLLATQ